MQPWVDRVLGAVAGDWRDRAYRERTALVCREEFEGQHFGRTNERSVEYAFVFKSLATICPSYVLDVGTGTTSLPHLMTTCGFVVTAIDNVHDYWTTDAMNRHFHVIDDDITSSQLEQSFDFITCVSVLEHIREADAAVASMFALLNPGGHLLLTFPYSEGEYVSNVYDLPGSSYGQDFAFTTQSFSRAEIDSWLTRHGGELVDQEYWLFWEGAHWTVGKGVTPPRRVGVDERHQISCLLIRKADLPGQSPRGDERGSTQADSASTA